MKLNYSEAVGKSWKSLQDDLPLVIGLTFVYLFGIWVLNFIPFIGNLISFPLSFGYLRCLIQIQKREIIGWPDFMWGFLNFNRFLQLILLQFLVGVGLAVVIYSLVIWIFPGIGLGGVMLLPILLFFPGVWWTIVTFFSPALFILGIEDSIKAIKKSLGLVRGRWWNIFGFFLFLGLLNLAGLLFFSIGLLISVPVSALALVIATEKMLEGLKPPTPEDPEFRPVDATVVSQT